MRPLDDATLNKIEASEIIILFRVPRWHIYKPKIPIWVKFGGSYNGGCWSILWPFGIHILWSFGIFYGHLVYFPRFGILNYEKSGNHDFGSKLDA
jgi:hypothetical protein